MSEDYNEKSYEEQASDSYEANPYRLVFDTETTGFPSAKVSYTDAAQNVVCELGASLVDIRDWKVQSSVSLILRTPCPNIPQFLVDEVHGISNELSMAIGVDSEFAVAIFIDMAKSANWQLVGHNIDFDIKMMAIMLGRSESYVKYVHDLLQADKYCTMQSSTNIVKCPPTPAMVKAGRSGQFKSPKLEQAYEFFAGEPMTNAHRAGGDVTATLFVYRSLMEGNF